MAGYGVYDGIGGLPYSVGNSGGAGAMGTQGAGVESGGGPIQKETQEQSTAGAYGASGYASLMPQWMQDYFDAHLAGNGYESLDKQRSLLTNELPYLQHTYGQKAAMNPYFTTHGADKGFDPFNNVLTESSSENGRWAEYNPQFTYNKTTTQTKNPFTGDVMGTNYKYDQTYGNSGDAGYNGGMNPYQLGLMAANPLAYGGTKGAQALGGAAANVFKKGW